MIYGIIAAASEYSLSLQGAPIASIGEFDFVNGDYSWDGTTLAASDITDKEVWIGASGLAVPGSAAAGAHLLYAAMTTLLATCNFTVAFEIETLSSSSADVLTLSNAGDAYYVQLSAHAEHDYQMQDYGGVGRYADDTSHGLTIGIHKIAATTASDRVSISVDGASVVTDTTTSTVPVEGFPMTKFYLGGWDSYTAAAINIRSFALYDVQPDAVLHLLSAP